VPLIPVRTPGPPAQSPTSAASAPDLFEPAGRDSTGLIGWVKPQTTEGTATFEAAYAEAAAGRSPLPAEAKDCVFLFVPGLFTKQNPGYLESNITRMRDLGLE